MSDTAVLDHLSAGSTYLELDEPDAYIYREDDGHVDGPWKVGIGKNGCGKTNGYRIHRAHTFRDALTLAINGFCKVAA